MYICGRLTWSYQRWNTPTDALEVLPALTANKKESSGITYPYHQKPQLLTTHIIIRYGLLVIVLRYNDNGNTRGYLVSARLIRTIDYLVVYSSIVEILINTVAV